VLSELNALKLEHEKSRRREENLAKQLLELDIFKLDIIARELKDMEELLKSTYKSVPQDKPGLKQDVGTLKEHAREIINKCLTETQKLHIGTTVQGHSTSLMLDILEALREIHPSYRPQTASRDSA